MTNYKYYLIAKFLWYALIFCVFTYIIFWKDASGWWYLFMLLIGGDLRSEKELHEGSQDDS